jgi:ATP-dependent protease HslVU (ClpYQ) peptidase subunit
MTVIVGISNDTNVYIGGDRGVSDNDSILSMSRPKITQREGWIFGYAGTLGTGQLIEFIDLPKVNKTDDPYKVLRLDIVEELKKAYDIYGRDIEDNGTDWLIAYQNRLFEISSGDWGVLEIQYSAIGSGSTFALGSLHTTRNWQDTKKRVHKAIEASIQFSPTCLEPIDIYNT